MKKVKLLLILVLLHGYITISGQSSFVQKNVNIPGTKSGYSRDLVEVDPNNFILIGTTYEQIGTNIHNRLTIAGIDGSGNYKWHKSYGNIKFNYIPMANSLSMMIMSNGFLYSALSVRDSNNRTAGVFIKFDLNGDTIWQRKHYGNIGQHVFYYCAMPSVDNGFLICGAIQTNTPGYNNHPTVGINIRKTDLNGMKIWDKAIYLTDLDYQNIGIDILQDSITKNIFVTGYETGFLSANAILIILDSLGNLKNKFGSAQSSPYYTNMVDIIQTRDKSYVGVGVFVSDEVLYTDNSKTLATLVKFDGNGIVGFRSVYDTLTVYNANTHVAELPNGNLIVVGEIDCLMNHYYGRNGFIRVMELDKYGNLIWKKYFDNRRDSNNIEDPMGMILTSDNQIAFTTASYWATYDTVYFTFYKTDISYCDPNAIGCYATGIPIWAKEDYSINLWPNPSPGVFNLSSDISNDLGGRTISIQNNLGQIVLETPFVNASSTYDLSRFNNGIYLVNIYQDGRRIYSNKLVLTR